MPLPPQKVADNARRALDIRKELPPSRRAMTPTGLGRARDLINRKNLSLDTVMRMYSFFSRHNNEQSRAARRRDKTSKAYQSWHGWGGDAGFAWAKRILRREGRI